MNFLKINFKKKLLLTSLALSNLYILIFTNLFFYSTYGADYERYINYIKYFLGEISSTGLEQGSLYFFLIALSVNITNDFINVTNLQSSISFSIQTVNTVLIYIGSLCYFKYFKHLKFDDIKILIVLNTINFFPPLFALRITMKPEVLIFTLLPVLLLNIDLFRKNKHPKYLLLSILSLSLIITTKGTFFAMIPLLLIFYYRNFIIELGFRPILLLILIFSIFSLPLFVENFSKNDNSLLTRTNPEKYNNRASVDIIYKNPEGNSFKIGPVSFDENTVLGITFLDTFGDYFNFYWKKDVSLFNKYKKDIFIKSDAEEILQFDIKNRNIIYSGPFKNNVLLLRDYLSYVFSSLLYILLIFLSFKDKKHRYIYLSPFIGIFVLYLNSLGIPENNFDPITADTFKVFYYSPILILAIMFAFLYFSNSKSFIISCFLFICLNLYILGFPKQDGSEYFNELHERNSISYLCEINKKLIYDLENDSNCTQQNIEICNNQVLKDNEISDFMLKKYEVVKNGQFCEANKSHVFANNLISRAPYINLIYLLSALVLSIKLRSDN